MYDNNLRKRERYANDPVFREAILAKRKSYWEKNKDAIRGKNAAYQKQYYKDHRAICSAKSKARHAANPQKNIDNAKRWTEALFAEMVLAYGGKCTCCGEATPKFLTLEHLNGGGGKHRKGKGPAGVWQELKRLGWPKDIYTILCMNCNLGKLRNGGVCPHQNNSCSSTSNLVGV